MNEKLTIDNGQLTIDNDLLVMRCPELEVPEPETPEPVEGSKGRKVQFDGIRSSAPCFSW